MRAMKSHYRRLVLSLVAAILCSCGGGGQPAQGPGFSIAARPATRAVVPGATGTGTVTVSPQNGFTGSVNVTISNVPAGVTVAPNPIQFSISSSPVSQPITVSATFDAQVHDTTLALTGSSGNVTASANLNLRGQLLSVTTWHYDNARTGVNPNENILNLANVNPNAFGKLFDIPADGAVVGQVSYFPNFSLQGKGGNK